MLATAIADMTLQAQRPWRVVMRRQALSLPNMFSIFYLMR
jgi:hypothetical protein